MAKKKRLIWAIAHIDRKYIERAVQDFKRYKEYKEVEVYIPTVKILSKEFKGKQQFDYVPLYLNYGFIGLPELLTNREHLEDMKKRIPCIFSWLLNKCCDEDELATVDRRTIEDIKSFESRNTIYTKENIDLIRPGALITLRGYPFDDMDAEVLEINKDRQTAKVLLLFGALSKEITVSFDNLIYTVYSETTEDGFREKSLEDIKFRSRSNLDRLFAKASRDNEEVER